MVAERTEIKLLDKKMKVHIVIGIVPANMMQVMKIFATREAAERYKERLEDQYSTKTASFHILRKSVQGARTVLEREETFLIKVYK